MLEFTTSSTSTFYFSFDEIHGQAKPFLREYEQDLNRTSVTDPLVTSEVLPKSTLPSTILHPDFQEENFFCLHRFLHATSSASTQYQQMLETISETLSS